MERNTELLEKTMQHIMDNPEQHDQGAWVNSCGTAACFAGWACLLTQGTKQCLDNETFSYQGKTKHAADLAMDLLGLTHKEAAVLFSGNNSREGLQLMVKDLVNGDELRDRREYSRQDFG